MRRHGVFAIAAILILHTKIHAETFDFATGGHFWNVAANWTPDNVPNAPGASAILPGPDQVGVDLSIDLGEPITIGSLQIRKPASPNSGNTFITGTNTLTVDGPTPAAVKLINGNGDGTGTGLGTSVIDVPVQLNSTWNVDQESDQQLRFIKAISGTGGLTIRRAGTSGTGGRTVVLSGANTYSGATTLTNAATNPGDDFLIVRLNNATAISTASSLNLGNSTVLEIASGNFARTPGTSPGQINFTGAGRNGFAAFDADRTVDLNGPITWGSLAGQVDFSQLVLGVTTSNAMVDFVNPLNMNGNRNIRSYNGSGAIDGRISGSITGGNLTKLNNGVLSLAGANSYTGFTRVEDGILRFDHSAALPSTSNLQFGGGVTIGIGADLTPANSTQLEIDSDFARDLGSTAGQVQLIGIGGNNQANGGFAAFNGDRTVVLNSNAELVWGSPFFLGGTAGTHSRNLILSDETSKNTITFTNPIELGAGNANPGLDETNPPVTRNIVVRDGSARIDAILPGELSGTSSLTKDNDGTLVLSGNNDYQGGTVVVGGRLLVNNTAGSGTGAGPVTLNGTSTLGGTGSIAGAVTANAGTHVAAGTPGTGIESLELGALTIETGSVLDFDLGLPNGTPGIDNDLLTIVGTTTLNGVGTVHLSDAPGFGAGTYTLIDYATLTGEITGFLAQTPDGPGGFTYALSDTGSTINLTVTAIPTNDADFNGDGVIDSADYVVWRKFNPIASPDGTQGTGDANGDSSVDESDYAEWVENFGTSPGGGGSIGVPEPTSLMLVGIAAIFALQRRGRWIRK